MNRVIIGRLGLLSFVAAVFATGCAFDQGLGIDDDETEQGDHGSELAAFGRSDQEQISAGEPALLRHNSEAHKPDNMVCAGCGPLPDPWKKQGPLPDPWTSSSGGSTSSGGTSDGKNNK